MVDGSCAYIVDDPVRSGFAGAVGTLRIPKNVRTGRGCLRAVLVSRGPCGDTM